MNSLCNAVTALSIVNITWDMSCFSEANTTKEVIMIIRLHHTSSAFSFLLFFIVSGSFFFHVISHAVFALPFSVSFFFLFLFFGAVKNPFNDFTIIMKLLLYGCYFIKY